MHANNPWVPFFTTAKAVIKYENRKIELKLGKIKISFPITPRYAQESLMGRKLKNNIDTSPIQFQEKILAWEARIKSYQETKHEGSKSKGKSNKVHVELEHSQPTRNHVPFELGDLVLLRHLEITIPPDKPSRWGYGPFIIKNISQDRMANLRSNGGGEVIASIDRLKHHHHDSNDRNYMGYIISRDDVT